MKQYIIDAFTEELFAGNPAAVLPCRSMPSAELMQKIAIENNYSETAFVVRSRAGEYDLKWFTPGGEVELCGHATLATSFVLHQFVDPGVPEMHFHTLSGELVVRACDEGGFTMDFPVGAYKPIPVSEAILAATGGLAQEAYYDGEGGDLIVFVPSEEALAAFVPDFDLMKLVDGRGIVMTAPASASVPASSSFPASTSSPAALSFPTLCRYDFVSRCFYPKLDVPEDPVTGSAHTYLTPLWAARLGRTEMTARQVSRRGGTLLVRLSGDRVLITGSARLFMSGDIPFDL